MGRGMVTRALSRGGTLLVLAWSLLVVGNQRSIGFLWEPSIALIALGGLLTALVVMRVDLDRLKPPRRWIVAAAAILVTVFTITHKVFSYTSGPDLERLTVFAGSCALMAGVMWLLWPEVIRLGGLALAICSAVVLALAVLKLDQHPHIDVWIFLTQAVDVTDHFHNMYTHSWVGSPGFNHSYPYLPMTEIPLIPAKLVLGDVRFAMVAALVAAGVLMVRGVRRHEAYGAVLLFAITPGLLALVEQSWTEPLLFVWLVAALFCVDRGRLVAAVVFLALALATKQHVVVLVPIFAVWQPFGWRRTLAAVGGAVLLCLPWALADLSAFHYGTVTRLVGMPPRLDAPELFTAAADAGWTPPRVLTILVILVGAAAATWRARQFTGAGAIALCCAFALYVVNLVNQQAFYNQWWLVGSLILVGLAWSPSVTGHRPNKRKARVAALRRADMVSGA
ncbi:MAG: hypothetical protein QOE01_1873 [Actinomycetota bacterium]|jgi:hypothetical protein|nr:hypothetical protein [Actinomycetota bacterium]